MHLPDILSGNGAFHGKAESCILLLRAVVFFHGTYQKVGHASFQFAVLQFVLLPGIGSKIKQFVAKIGCVDQTVIVESVSSDSLDPAFVAEEQEIARQQLIQEGKPEHLLEKILPGKLKALYAQSCLLNQGFVKDPSVSVDALLKQVGKELGDEISVVSFVRYQLGA